MIENTTKKTMKDKNTARDHNMKHKKGNKVKML